MLALDADDYNLLAYKFCAKIDDSLIVPADICQIICFYLMSLCVTISSTLGFPTSKVHFHIQRKSILKGLADLRRSWSKFECFEKDGYIYPDEHGVNKVPDTNYAEFRVMSNNQGSPSPFKFFCYHSHQVSEFSVPVCARFETWTPFGHFDLFKLRFVLYHQHEDPTNPYIFFGIEYTKHRSSDYIMHCDQAKKSGKWDDPSLHGISSPLLVHMQWGNLLETKFYPYYHETDQKFCREQRIYNKLDIFESNIRRMREDVMCVRMQIHNALTYFSDGERDDEHYGYYSASNDIPMDFDPDEFL